MYAGRLINRIIDGVSKCSAYIKELAEEFIFYASGAEKPAEVLCTVQSYDGY